MSGQSEMCEVLSCLTGFCQLKAVKHWNLCIGTISKW
jgi:hypothetical protein